MAGGGHEDQRVTDRRSNGNRGSAGLCKQSFRSAPAFRLPTVGALAALALIMVPGPPNPAEAQTFDQALFPVLQEICEGNLEEEGVGPNLTAFCQGNTPAGAVSAAPAAASPQASAGPIIERRLQAVRESEERRREAGSTRAIYAFYPRDRDLAETRQLQIPPASGASPEIVVGPAQGLSLFLSAGAFALDHHNNRFEDGYQAQLPTVTVGADYWLTPRLLAGVGFNYTNFDGTYDDGGGFDKDIFNPLLYATWLPFERAFVNAVAGYARSENSNDRHVVIATLDENTDPPGIGDPFTGHASADYSENVYSAGLQAGYDHPLGNFTIGPRLGVAFSYSEVDSFEEEGDTGLELRYSGLDQTSVQSSLGLAATVAIPIPHGVLLPQASVAWVHEYANDARNIDARFVEAPNSPTFTFQRERPARDWANIAVGVSASFVNGMQPFVQLVTVQGNENFVTYGGTAGLRYSF